MKNTFEHSILSHTKITASLFKEFLAGARKSK